MKKILIFLLCAAMSFAANAQSFMYIDFTAASGGDSLVGATTKYFYMPTSKGLAKEWTGSVEVLITPSLSSSDSTHVWIEASTTNTSSGKWYKVTNFGTPYLNVGTYYATNTVTAAAGYDYKGRMGTSTASWMWAPLDMEFNAPYYRIAVQHFKAATSVKVTRARMYIKN